ncbi:MAG: hypothetical protein JNL11_02590 [Bdellovibrionaceae bacterium]|nr:hypothetical protein [Pseudobdellovibrionaceae bacterium]
MKLLFSFLLALPLSIWANQNLYFSSPNLCARQSMMPAKSVYIFIDGFGPGRAATKWAREAGKGQAELVATTWQQLHARSFFLSKRIIQRMLSGELPLFTSAQLKACGATLDCPEFQTRLAMYRGLINEISSASLVPVQCTWIKKALPISFSTRIPDKNDLENLAVAYLDKANYIDTCEKIFSGETQKSIDLVLKFDLPELSRVPVSFEFWRSFKIYLSLFWGQKWTNLALHNQEIVRSFAVDEIVTLMADGCYSLSNPSCDTDFLNVAQLKNTLRKGGFQNSNLMANEILKTQVAGLNDRLTPAPQNMSAAVNVREDMLSLMKMRHQSSFELYKSVKKLNLIFSQKSSAEMYGNLSPLLKASVIEPEIYTLCAEIGKVVATNLSPYAHELAISKNKVFGLNDISLINQNPDQLFRQAIDFLEMLKPLCQKVDDDLKQQMMASESKILNNMIPARQWFQTITRYTLPNELSSPISFVSDKARVPVDTSYIKVQNEAVCPSVVECTRDVMESLVHIYQVALYRNIAMSKQANEITPDRHLGGDVACGLFDPWEKSQLRKKNLVSDIVSAVISGVTMLPVFLDLDFDTKNLTSFQQLYDNGQIKFDPQYDDRSLQTTLFLDLGPMAKSPCYVSISNSSKIKSPDTALLFQGVTFQGCIQNGSGQIVSNNLNAQTSRVQELSACGACTLNFETVGKLAVQSHFNVFRFGIRFVAALSSFFRDQENPINSPMELTVNPEYVKDAYLKYNSIPDKCMYELVNGARCMENICLSYTISKVEEAWNVRVKDGSVWNSQQDDQFLVTDRSYSDAWLKLDGCDRETRIPIRCDRGKKPTYVKTDFKVPTCAKRFQ